MNTLALDGSKNTRLRQNKINESSREQTNNINNLSNSDENSNQDDSENERMESEDEGTKPKQKNKTLHRIQKNISSYLNDPTPEKIKQMNVNCH